MSAPASAVDRRPVPAVAIVGNDAVLAAAPATPVQLAHACLRRGFSVAVPASWGDELVATEAVRRLATRERGPAVMCVCPYVRSRLLAPGPDLAPFLVSLVSPPVATARYLRAAYGSMGVHITYVGACPSADDPTIDARLTPNDFLVDLAEHGIALSEQPLVFDSIVPPDRRRWSSQPGGIPSAEALWTENDTRTLIEIDRDDASTDLAQHIIAREHVLLDLAPSLGCACSGAVGSLPPRSARAAVTSLEPPRALSPVIDGGNAVALDAPVATSALGAVRATIVPSVAAAIVANPGLERVLDEMLGGGPQADVDDEAEPRAEAISDAATVVAIDEPLLLLPPVVVETAQPVSDDTIDVTGQQDEVQPLEIAVIYPPPVEETHEAVATEAPADVPGEVEEVPAAAEAIATDVAVAVPNEEPPAVRRRTPPTVHTRYSTTGLPKATGADGRPLPRAYAAKRRTPPAGAVVVSSVAAPPPPPAPAVPAEAPALTVADAPPTAESADAATETGPVITEVPPSAPLATPTVAATPAPAPSKPAPTKAAAEQTGDNEAGAGSVAAPATHQGALVFLLVTALVALGVFVLFSLRR